MTDTDVNTPHEDGPPKPVRKKAVRKKQAKSGDKGVGLPLVLLCSGIAALLGITGGAMLSGKLNPPTTLQADQSQFVAQAELDDVKSTLQSLQARTAVLETAQSELGAGTGETLQDTSLDDIQARLEALESRSQSTAPVEGEKTENVETASEDSDERAENTSVQNDENPDSPVSEPAAESESSEELFELQAELKTLSGSLSALEDKIKTQSGAFVKEAELNAIKRRVKKLEDDFEKPPVLIPPFPREAVMDAITGKSEKSGSWMSGLLGDEVRVVDADIVGRLDRIEKHVEAGDINAIDKELSFLPPETKPVIDGWLRQFEQNK